MDQAHRDGDMAYQVAVGGTSTEDTSGSSSAQPKEIDNESFLVSLSSELWAEVLLTADPAFIASLTPEQEGKSQMQTDQATEQWQKQEIKAVAHSHTAIAINTSQVRHAPYHTPYRYNLSMHPFNTLYLKL